MTTNGPFSFQIVFHGLISKPPWFYFLIFFILSLKTSPVSVIEATQAFTDETSQRGKCTVISTDSLKEYGRTHRYKNGIPRIIHYVSTGNYIASQYTPLVKECMKVNNDARFVLWNDFTAYGFMIKTYQKYIRLYSSYFAKFAIRLKRSDMIRYILLLEFGGVYMDLDTKCQKPFGSVFVNDSCILSREAEVQSQILHNMEYLAMNSLMACVAGHDFYKYVVDHLVVADGSSVLWQTGPMFLTNKLRVYRKRLFNESVTTPLNSITLTDSDMFSPYIGTSLDRLCNGSQTLIWKRKGCKDLAEYRKRQPSNSDQAVTIHLFLHHGYHKGSIKSVDHICHTFREMHLVWV